MGVASGTRKRHSERRKQNNCLCPALSQSDECFLFLILSGQCWGLMHHANPNHLSASLLSLQCFSWGFCLVFHINLLQKNRIRVFKTVVQKEKQTFHPLFFPSSSKTATPVLCTMLFTAYWPQEMAAATPEKGCDPHSSFPLMLMGFTLCKLNSSP